MLVARPPRPRSAAQQEARSLLGTAVALLLLLISTGAPATAEAATAQLNASPSSPAAGTSITVTGVGFPRNTAGYVTFDAGASGPTYRANGKGSFSVALAIPATAAPGSHAVVARAQSGATIASTSISVAVAPTPTPATAGYGAADGVICDGRFSVTQSGTTLALPYCSSRSIVAPSSSITRVIVVVHGDSRNAPDHLRYVTSAASLAGVSDALVVAPQFLVAEDLSTASLRSSALYWTSSGWKQGDKSSTTAYWRPWSLSSFAVLDTLLATVGNRAVFPNLREVVVVGHSAGGQLADRYAAGTAQPTSLGAFGIAVRFIVANPSSYLYVDANRFHPATSQFTALTTAERQACAGYDSYKYGLSGLNAYTGAVGAATLKSRYGARPFTYLLGALDTDPADASLDTNCAAQWQGSQRLERGTIHFQYLGTVFGQGVYATHELRTVPGVGHDAKNIYGSVEGRGALFGSPG